MELQFYFHESEKEGWKVRELKRQMKSSLFKRLALSTDKKGILALANKDHQIITAQDIIRDPNVLEFTGLPQKKRYKEGELKAALKANMEHKESLTSYSQPAINFICQRKKNCKLNWICCWRRRNKKTLCMI